MTMFPSGNKKDKRAIHVNRANEISGITEKVAPAAADLIVIEDSAAANVKKRVQIGNLGGGGNSIFTAAYGARPAASNDGDLFLPNNGFVEERDTGAAWVPWGPTFPFVHPDDSDFVWINQGGASVVEGGGGIFLSTPANVATNARVRKKAAPGVPYVITAAISPLMYDVDFANFGILFRQSSDGKLVIFGLNRSSLFVFKMSDPTTGDGTYSITPIHLGYPLLFLRIEDNNTNRICSWSTDGQNFIVYHTIGRTDYLTADEVGFMVDSSNVNFGLGITLLSWEEA